MQSDTWQRIGVGAGAMIGVLTTFGWEENGNLDLESAGYATDDRGWKITWDAERGYNVDGKPVGP